MTTSTIGVDHERIGRASPGPRAVIRLLPPAVSGALIALVALVALLALGPMAAPAQAVVYSVEEAALVKLINDYRASNGLQPLLVSDALSESGDRHSSDMGKYRFFDHYTQASDWFAKGASPWDRMAASGYSYDTWKGENVAAGYATAAQALAGWKNSSSHNANMLKADFKVLGVSLVSTSGSPYVHYWTTDFGGYVDPTAHAIGSTQPTSTTTTVRPTTTTLRPTTTTARPTTTTIVRPPATTTTTMVRPTTTTTARPTTTTATVRSGSAPIFSDVSVATPYADAINVLATQGIVSGYPDGTFRPERVISRQQIAKMLALTAGYPVSALAPCSFVDVEPRLDAGDPLYPQAYIAACAAHGVIMGKTPGLFAPYDPVTRAQIVTMVARAAELPASSPIYVPPFPNFSPDHYPWAVRAAEAGLLDGLREMGPDYDFGSEATRGEVCEVLAGLLR